MITLDKLRVIAKAKFSDKSKLGNWYTERLELCSGCPYNSSNKEDLSVKELAMVAMNFGKPTCLGCGCEIAAKASVRASVCGLENIGMEPVWNALPEIDSADISRIRIDNYSADKVKLRLDANPSLVYGTIKYGSNTEITISLQGIDASISDLAVSVSCGCTSGVVKEIGGKFYVTLKYDSTRLGDFRKSVSIRFTQYNITKSLSFKLEGTVIR